MSDMEMGKSTEPVKQSAASGRIVVMAKKSHRRRNLLLIIGGAVLLVAAGAVAWYFLIGPAKTSNVAFTIDGHDYTKDQINNLIEYPVSQGASRDDVAKQAFEMYKRQTAAQKTGVVISDDQIATAQKKLFPNLISNLDGSLDANTAAWVKLVSYDNVLNEIVATSPIYSNASGYIYLFWFTHHLTYNADRPVSGIGDQTLILADRQYAQGRADYYRQQLINKTMTPDQVMQEVKADERLGYTNGLTDNQSLRFTEISYSNQYDSVLRNIPMDAQERAVKVGTKTGVDEIQTGSITITDADAAADNKFDGEGANPRQAEAYFYLLDIDKASTQSYSLSNYTSTLNGLTSNYRGLK